MKRRRRIHLIWPTLLIVIGGYATAAWVCVLHPDSTSNILACATVYIGLLCAVPVGIRYGTQDKEYWM